MTAQPKYRPSLTAVQMQHIIHLIDNSGYNPISVGIKKVLQPLIYKASEGIIQPAFVTAPKQSIEDSLGFSTRISEGEKSLYQLWREGVKLSEGQIETAMGYGFNNDLLTEEECDRYTQLLMKSS